MLSRALAWARRASTTIGSIDDVTLAVRMVAGTWAVRRRKHREPLATLVRRFHRQASGTVASPSHVIDLAWLVCRASKGGGHGNCLERSLVLYGALGETGARPELWFGVRAGEPRDGHVWVVLDGVAAGDDPQLLRDYAPLLVFDADARLVRGSDAPPSISWSRTRAASRLEG